MSLTVLTSVKPNTFTPEDRENAREASRALARLSGRGAVEVIADAGTDHRQTFVLPAAAVHLLTDMLVHLAEGRNVSVMQADAALTTQQAADMLNVSRPYLIGLLEKGELPFQMVNTHRRIALAHVLAYRDMRDAQSRSAREALLAEAQEIGLGY